MKTQQISLFLTKHLVKRFQSQFDLYFSLLIASIINSPALVFTFSAGTDWKRKCTKKRDICLLKRKPNLKRKYPALLSLHYQGQDFYCQGDFQWKRSDDDDHFGTHSKAFRLKTLSLSHALGSVNFLGSANLPKASRVWTTLFSHCRSLHFLPVALLINLW